MKSIFTILTVLSISPAFAVSYECTHADGQKLKIFQEKPDHAVAVLQTGQVNQIFKGNFTYQDETLYEVTQYELTDSKGNPSPVTLTKRIVMGRGGCGRGGCHESPGLSTKIATLTLNGASKSFGCQ